MKLFLKNYWPFLILAVLAFTAHLAYLGHPAQVVFDEVHFGKFVAAYFTHQYYFDVHPPLGKLMIAGFVKLLGLNPVFDFNHIGEQAAANFFFVLRFLPAFFGGLFVLAFSWLAYLISRSKTTALIAGFLILLDNAFLVQSKFIFVDIFLLLFEVLTFCFFFLWQRKKSFSAKWFLYLILTAVFFGLTISIKWTGLATMGIIGVILIAKNFSQKLVGYLSPEAYQLPDRPPNIAKEIFAQICKKKFLKIKEAVIGLILLIGLGFSVYLIPFAIHFKLLPLSGPGNAFMSVQFQNELKYGVQNYSPPLTLAQKVLELNITMLKANAGITADHPFGSRWPTWPLDYKPIYYWNQDSINGKPGYDTKIYFLGNPVIWWLAGIFIILTLTKILTKKGRTELAPIFYILLLAYFANFLPFIFVKRISFLYYYLPPATFAILILSLYLTTLQQKGKSIFVGFFALIFLAFIFICPVSYGFAMPPILMLLYKGKITLGLISFLWSWRHSGI